MNPTTTKKQPSYIEFIVLISLMMSLTALSIDAMLPALPQIGADLGVQNENSRQLVVSVIFLGIAVGQIFFGPLSDKTGRKPPIYIGYSLYLIGSLVAVFSVSFPMLLAGRVMQGLGVSAPRAVTLALVRDRFKSEVMAQVMSFVMTVFVIVPMIAPILGQSVMKFSSWRGIFVMFIGLAVISLVWFIFRIPETLAPENRAPFSLSHILTALVSIFKNRVAIGFTVMSGLIFGAHLGYLNSAQQIFQEIYKLGDRFPLFFAVIALSIGLASFSNSRLVMRFGMRFLVRWALRISFTFSVVALGFVLLSSGQPPLWLLTAYLMVTFYCVGILYGNMNSLAMEPLGHVAGIGAAVIGSLSTVISMVFGTLIGQNYNGTVFPLVIGMLTLVGASLLVMYWIEKKVDK